MNIFKTESGIGDKKLLCKWGRAGGGIAEVRLTGKDGEEEL